MANISVYFFCSNEKFNYQHDIVILAEGLKSLGISIYANENYWKQSVENDDYLFKKDSNIDPEDCNIVVFPGNWFNWVKLFEKPIRKKIPISLKGKKNQIVYLDSSDGYKTVSFEPEFRDFDLILRSHYNELCFQPSNFKPWAFGLPQRIINEFKNIPDYSHKANKILCNFGASHGYMHSLRSYTLKKFNPKLQTFMDIDYGIENLQSEPKDLYEKLMWEQCWGRFNRSYYKRIAESKANLCFCGDLIPKFPYNPSKYLVGGNKAKIYRKYFETFSIFKSQRCIQWDSWRYWESLAGGCVPIHIDFEKYGVKLPIMPENWKHYIGVDLDKISQIINRLKDEPRILENISKEGRSWALEHYSPKATAKRFLNYLGYTI